MFLQVKSWSLGRHPKNASKGKQGNLHILTLKYEVTKLVWQECFNYMSAFTIAQGLPFWLSAVPVAQPAPKHTQQYHQEFQQGVRLSQGCPHSWAMWVLCRHRGISVLVFTKHFFALELGYCKGISFAKIFVYPHCTGKKQELFWWEHMMVPSFQTDFRHCHRFSATALFFACFSCSSGMTTFSSKSTKPGLALRSLRAGPHQLPCIGHVSAVATIPLLSRFQLGTHPFDLKRTYFDLSEDTLHKRSQESAVSPLHIFPTSRENPTPNTLETC